MREDCVILCVHPSCHRILIRQPQQGSSPHDERRQSIRSAAVFFWPLVSFSAHNHRAPPFTATRPTAISSAPFRCPDRAHACRCYPYSITEVNIKLEFICGWCFCENYGQSVRHVADTFFDTLLPPHPVCGRPSEGLSRSYLRLRLRMKQRQVVRQSKHRR